MMIREKAFVGSFKLGYYEIRGIKKRGKKPYKIEFSKTVDRKPEKDRNMCLFGKI
jgi:hypothetical protein